MVIRIASFFSIQYFFPVSQCNNCVGEEERERGGKENQLFCLCLCFRILKEIDFDSETIAYKTIKRE